MSPSVILSASWDKYDLKKELTLQDKNIFCPENLWEFNYLMDTIIKTDPKLDIITVMLAMRKVMRETMAPRPRTNFVQAVVQSICEREDQLVEMLQGINKIAS